MRYLEKGLLKRFGVRHHSLAINHTGIHIYTCGIVTIALGLMLRPSSKRTHCGFRSLRTVHMLKGSLRFVRASLTLALVSFALLLIPCSGCLCVCLSGIRGIQSNEVAYTRTPFFAPRFIVSPTASYTG